PDTPAHFRPVTAPRPPAPDSPAPDSPAPDSPAPHSPAPRCGTSHGSPPRLVGCGAGFCLRNRPPAGLTPQTSGSAGLRRGDGESGSTAAWGPLICSSTVRIGPLTPDPRVDSLRARRNQWLCPVELRI